MGTNMKKILGSIAVLSLAMPLAANAADLPPAAPAYKAPVVAPMPAYNWTGFYIGGSIGGEWETVDGNFIYPPAESWGISNTRGMWDGHIGAQYQWGSVVFGVEGDYVGLFGNNNGGSSTCVTCAIPGSYFTANLNNQIWTIGGKLGWAWGAWMGYVSGGYANTKVNNSLFSPGGFLIESTQTQHDGAYAGIGFDWQVWNTPSGALVAGIEYRHYWFQSVTATPTFAGGGPNNIDTWSIQPQADTVEAKLSWLFNWGGPVYARY
jgi:outer membrane immunogenic protein